MNFLGIFRAQNDRLVVGYLMGADIFKFRPNFSPISACGSCLKRATVKAFWPILPYPFSDPHILGLEWTFWTFSVLKMIVLSLAI